MNGKQMLILVEYLQFPKSKNKSLAPKNSIMLFWAKGLSGLK